ncbi:hypothetical protein TNCV_2187311 [Trichonephila clavipes]|nr:hypothetical protein TNCV_2187311 [Trichonephila clavipes]
MWTHLIQQTQSHESVGVGCCLNGQFRAIAGRDDHQHSPFYWRMGKNSSPRLQSLVTGSRIFPLTCPLSYLRPELMATLFQPNPRSEV